MEVVKAGMGHGDLSMEAYSQVWEECYGQVNIPLCSFKTQVRSLKLVFKRIFFLFNLSAGSVSANSEQVHQS